MQEELHYRGVWYLPDKPDEQIPGDLYYSPLKGIDLKLLGVFNNKDIPIIRGTSADGKQITLYKAHVFERGFSTSGFETSTYGAIFMFVGNRHVEGGDRLSFSRINCTWIDFDIWLGIYGLQKAEQKRESKEVSVEYRQPENIHFDVSEKMKCEFRFGINTPLTKRVSKYFIEQHCAVCFIPKTEREEFELLFEQFESFYRLMTLAYFEEPQIKKMFIYQDQTEGEELYSAEFQVYYQTDVSEVTYKKRNTDYSFLFTYKDVKQYFESILKKWYKAEEVMGPVTRGLAESFTKRPNVTEFKFLNLAHSIETLHRRTSNRTAINPDAFKEKLKNIIESVADEYKDWLKEKLAYSNELTLQERLMELISQIPEPVQKVLFKPDADSFVKSFKNNRNYYTHYDKSLEKKALKGGALFSYSERVKIFLVCLILKHIGFTEEELTKTIFRVGVKLFNHIIKYDEAKAHFNDWQ